MKQLFLLLAVVAINLPARVPQNGRALTALDKEVPADALVVLPKAPASIAIPLQRLSAIARIPVGVEDSFEAPQSVEFPVPAVNLSGLHLPKAVDTLVQFDKRYTWRTLDDVIVVRPATSWADRNNMLNRKIGTVTWSGVTVPGAMDALFLKLTGEQYNTGSLPGWDTRFDINLADATILDVLNAIVRAHRALMWRVSYQTPDSHLDVSRPNKFGIGFSTYEGHSRWHWVPTMPPHSID